MDLVSIITPCYNDGSYLMESINSVFNQTYPNIEIMVIDDGSDDPTTIAVVKGLSDPRIQVLHTDHVGPAAARNHGIEKCKGKYILSVDADDRIDPTYIEKCVNIIANDSKIGVVYCKGELFGEQTGPWELPDYSFDKMLLDNIVFVTAMFRRSDWERIGGFNVRDFSHGMEDYDFWLSMLELDLEIVQIPETMFFYRIKPASRTTRFLDNIQNVQDIYVRIYDNHPILYQKHREQYAKILRRELISHVFMCRDLKKSFGTLEKVAKLPLLKQLINKFIFRR